MLTLNYFLLLFPERPFQLSTSTTTCKWLKTKANPWDALPQKQWPIKAKLLMQEGIQKSQVHPVASRLVNKLQNICLSSS